MRIDPDKTTLVVHTKAEGLFSKLAHDLELEARGLTGAFEGDHGTVRVPIAGIRVVGALRRGKVDASVLSARDKEDIDRKLVEEILAGAPDIEVDVTAEGNDLRLHVRAPKGAQRVTCKIEREPLRARGECELSLSALGVREVRGPMGAFRVADRVRVSFDAVLVE